MILLRMYFFLFFFITIDDVCSMMQGTQRLILLLVEAARDAGMGTRLFSIFVNKLTLYFEKIHLTSACKILHIANAPERQKCTCNDALGRD